MIALIIGLCVVAVVIAAMGLVRQQHEVEDILRNWRRRPPRR